MRKLHIVIEYFHVGNEKQNSVKIAPYLKKADRLSCKSNWTFFEKQTK
jgi:hypothetical protein